MAPLCDVGAQSARISEPERFWRQRRLRPARLRAFPRARRPEASEGDRADWRNRSDPGGTGAGRRGSDDARGVRREVGGPQASRGARRGTATVMGSPEQSGLQAPARRASPHRAGADRPRGRPPAREGRPFRRRGRDSAAPRQRAKRGGRGSPLLKTRVSGWPHPLDPHPGRGLPGGRPPTTSVLLGGRARGSPPAPSSAPSAHKGGRSPPQGGRSGAAVVGQSPTTGGSGGGWPHAPHWPQDRFCRVGGFGRTGGRVLGRSAVAHGVLRRRRERGRIARREAGAG